MPNAEAGFGKRTSPSSQHRWTHRSQVLCCLWEKSGHLNRSAQSLSRKRDLEEGPYDLGPQFPNLEYEEANHIYLNSLSTLTSLFFMDILKSLQGKSSLTRSK